jgi:hypothetical protein
MPKRHGVENMGMKQGAKKLLDILTGTERQKDEEIWLDINQVWPEIDKYGVFQTDISQAEVEA